MIHQGHGQPPKLWPIHRLNSEVIDFPMSGFGMTKAIKLTNAIESLVG